MADVLTDNVRLSPVFDRTRDADLSKMEGLDPERAKRLLRPRSPEMSPTMSVGPQRTGSNALALGAATIQKPVSIKQELSPSRNGGAQSLVHIPKHTASVITGVKRPRDHLDDQEPYRRPQWDSSPPILPPRK